VGAAPAAPAAPAPVWIEVHRRKGEPSWSADLCLACRQRNDRAQGEWEAARRAAVVESEREAGQWLRGAPVLETLPAPESTYAERYPHVPFVEVMGFHTASRHLARLSHGLGQGRTIEGSPAGRMPRSYQKALTGSAPYPDEHRLYLYGSVYRPADGDVALHWHSSHLYPSIG
jgi:hypothetical protein